MEKVISKSETKAYDKFLAKAGGKTMNNGASRVAGDAIGKVTEKKSESILAKCWNWATSWF